MSSEKTAIPVLDIAHVLFMDIVAYSKLPMDEQRRTIKEIQDAVRSTSDFIRAQERDQLIRLPTGDGMALVFFDDPEAPARCALELSRMLRCGPNVPLRIGLHTGPVYRMSDINANRNVSGGGINLAQRVMDCGDAGHILVSATAAEMLGELSNWKNILHELGEAEVKHGVKLHLFNLYTDDAGNHLVPYKLAVARKKSSSHSRSAAHADSDYTLAGQTIGHYHVLRPIGAGGMGIVYEAEDIRLGRHVALKFMPGHPLEDAMAMERFRREATLASKLNHPHICTLYDIGEDAGQHFIVLELLDGETLRTRIGREGALPLDQLLVGSIQIADALDAAHSLGVVHRDIKPGNIFVTRRGTMKIVDFGLAKLTNAKASAGVAAGEGGMALVTSPGTAMGTIAYMSPEQARGEDTDCRTDLFSFGIVLYEMATGRSPFCGSTTAIVFDAILNRTEAPITSVDPKLPVQLQKIVSRALQKDRTKRYQSANEIRVDLTALQRATKREAVPWRQKPGWMKSRHLPLWVAVLLFAIFGLSAALWKRHLNLPALIPVARPLASSTSPKQAVIPAALPVAQPTDRLTSSSLTGTGARTSEPSQTSLRPSTRREPANPEERHDSQRSPAELSDHLTGFYSGRLKNSTLSLDAAATMTLDEQRGAVSGCLQVARPLGGSSSMIGIATAKHLLINANYAGGRIEFRGQLVGPELRGTYTVFGTDGHSEQGSFFLTRRSAQGLPANFDPRNCPRN